VSPMGYGSRVDGTKLPSADGADGSSSSVEDDGRRVTLDPHVQPEDDRTYVMYHGTRPAAAEAIEKYGFGRSRDGMLGEGVYLSRDVTKAAHYPLDVPFNDHAGRVILECLVNVGKVKRIDSVGHPMQKTWMILGYDTAWVPPHCGMVPSGLEEDCVSDPKRVIVLRRVQVQAAAKEAAARKAQEAQRKSELAKASAKAKTDKVAAASGGRGQMVSDTSVRHKSSWMAPSRSSRAAKQVEAKKPGRAVRA
jgi:hypothetical protein